MRSMVTVAVLFAGMVASGQERRVVIGVGGGPIAVSARDADTGAGSAVAPGGAVEASGHAVLNEHVLLGVTAQWGAANRFNFASRALGGSGPNGFITSASAFTYGASVSVGYRLERYEGIAPIGMLDVGLSAFRLTGSRFHAEYPSPFITTKLGDTSEVAPDVRAAIGVEAGPVRAMLGFRYHFGARASWAVELPVAFTFGW